MAVGTMMLATVAVAQDAPELTVTKNWFQTVKGNDVNQHRFGTGMNGKVYMPGKTSQNIKVYDGTTVSDLSTQGANLALCLTHDDAGNLIFHGSWPSGAKAGQTWYVLTPDGQLSSFALEVPEDLTGDPAGRMDQPGRAIGDAMSDEGALLLITDQNTQSPWIMKIANGKQVPADFTDFPVADDTNLKFDSTSVGQFTYTFEEVCDMGEDWVNAVALRARGWAGNVPYWKNEEGDWKPVATVAGAKSSEGFDMFVLGDKVYLVNPAGDVNYTTRFKIVDVETGDVVYYSEDEASVAAGQGFGSITANKVDDNTVEIYICGQTNANPGLTYAGMYTVKLGGDEPVVPADLYIVGQAFGTEPSAPAVMEYADGKYTMQADNASGWFKISTTKGTWDEYNAGVIGIAEDNQNYVVELDKEYTLEAGKIGNCAFPGAGNYVITVDGETKTMVVTGETFEVKAPEHVWVRGLQGVWDCTEANAMTLTEERGMANEFVYAIEIEKAAAGMNFKIADQNWGDINYGRRYDDGMAVKVGSFDAWHNCNDFILGEDLNDVTMKFYWNPDKNMPSYLVVEQNEVVAPKYSDHSHFAYNLSVEKGEKAIHTVKFHSTGDAANAYIVLNEVEGDDAQEFALGEVVKGENTKTVDLSALKEGAKYNWGIRIHNHEITEDIITEPENVGGGRAGVVCFTNPENEFYGYTVIARTKNGGFDVYNAAGEKVADKIHATNAAMGGSGANTSSPMQGVQRGTEAVFASWGDAANGVVAFDLADMNAEPYGVFEGTKASSGAITNAAGEGVGSGTPGLCFQGKGDETILVTFDEDLFGNCVAVNRIGDNKTTSKAAENWGFKSTLANTNVGFCAAEEGFFSAQIRGNGMEEGTPSIAYFNTKAQDIVWKAADMAEEYEDFMPSCTRGIDINAAGDLLAVTLYGGVKIFFLSWEDGEYAGETIKMPVLEPYKTILTSNIASNYCDLKFDAGNNLHIINQSKGYFQIKLADKEPIAHTPAASNSFISVASGVESIAIEAVNNGAEAYYNLNGVKVAAEQMVPGVYVKVANGKAQKVVVK